MTPTQKTVVVTAVFASLGLALGYGIGKLRAGGTLGATPPVAPFPYYPQYRFPIDTRWYNAALTAPYRP